MGRRLIVCAVIVTIALGGVAGYAISDSRRSATADTARAGDDISTALDVTTVTRQDLARFTELDGTAGYGTPMPLSINLAGTLTRLPTPGDEIEPGDVLAEVDGQPVIAADGDVPLWRELRNGVDDGADVRVVEHLLADLGYGVDHDVTVDEEWTAATTAALKDFQEAVGQTTDGVVDLGEIVVVGDATRIAAVGGSPGQANTEAAISVTPTTPVIAVDISADQGHLVAAGDAVTVELPDGTELAATISAVGPATTADDGSTSIPVEVTLDAAGAAASVPTGTPVDVLVGVVAAENVLTVPVEALLAVAEGGYAVEMLDGSATRLVGVDIGVFAEGRVEISPTTGELTAGDEVVMPG